MCLIFCTEIIATCYKYRDKETASVQWEFYWVLSTFLYANSFELTILRWKAGFRIIFFYIKMKKKMVSKVVIEFNRRDGEEILLKLD